MVRRYDSRTTIFSPEGRLFQVEYAMEAISHAGTTLGLVYADGVLLLAERKVTSKLLETGAAAEKLYKVHDALMCGVAGVTADANTLVDIAREVAQRHLMRYGEVSPPSVLVREICDWKQGYTQFGGLRPYGVSILYAAHDTVDGFQLYQSDPSGNYACWRATCIGSNNAVATAMLRSEHDKFAFDQMNETQAFDTALHVFSKTLDTNTLDAEKLEIAMLSRDQSTGNINGRILTDDEVQHILVKHAHAITSASAAPASSPAIPSSIST